MAALAPEPPKPINAMPAPSAIKYLRIALYLTFHKILSVSEKPNERSR
jgi:hypothetical protein